jgi:hypothetical protein
VREPFVSEHIIPGVLLLMAAVTSFSAHAGPTPQQVRDNFEIRMVQPCQGKKNGDEVTITSSRGDKIKAVCTLTAIPAAH